LAQPKISAGVSTWSSGMPISAGVVIAWAASGAEMPPG
jgi:hypothetical protein